MQLTVSQKIIKINTHVYDSLTKRYQLMTICGVTAYDTVTPLCKSGLAQQLLPYAQQNPMGVRPCVLCRPTVYKNVYRQFAFTNRLGL